jgi:uncharacterized protein (DUF2141 family)
MKTTLTAALLIGLVSAAAHAEAPPAPATFTLTVTVEGIRSADGAIKAQLLKADQAAGTASTVGGKDAPAVVGAITLSFAGLAPGDYAVRMFHDEDGDGEMKTNVFGIPKEGFGFSNRAVAKFGPPSFSDMKVTVAADTVSAATMTY